MTNEQRATEVAAQEEIGVVADSSTVFGKRATAFNALVSEYEAVAEGMRQLEAEKKAIQSQLQRWFSDADIKTVMCGTTRVTLVQSEGRSTIDKMKLIERGVPASVISECTVQGQPFSFIKVTAPKGK